jgi:uracil permease
VAGEAGMRDDRMTLLNYRKEEIMYKSDTAIRDARTLGIPKMMLLSFQHLFAMFGATILVPILVNSYFEGEGLSIQVTLFCAGMGTLIFHFCSKFKVPALL